MQTTIPIASEYRRCIFHSLVVQALLAIFSMMFLDGGRIAHTTGIAVLAFWAGATLVILRRPKLPTRLDLELIRLGFVPLLVLTFVIAEWIWSWHWVWKIRGV